MKDDIITIKSLSKSFEGNPSFFALKNITLSIKRGAIFGIIGTSGAGKSTLLRCLTGLDKATHGHIGFQKEASFGMIFQNFNLFSSKNALENVCFPMIIAGISKEEAKKRGRELLSLVKLKSKENAYPSCLSGGEKQRVAIARALARNPSILFSDEATSALDPPTRKAILDLLSELNRKMGVTIVLITHEMEVIKQICTDVAVIENGEIIEEGRVEDLFASPKENTTKKFLQTLALGDIPEDLFDHKNKDQELLHLYFKGKGAKEPIISHIVKHFDVEVNILLGGLDRLKTTIVGNLVISLTGPSLEREKVHRFLEEKEITYKGINYE